MPDYLNSKLNSPYLPDLQPLPNFALQDLQSPPNTPSMPSQPTQSSGTAGTLALLAQMGALGNNKSSSSTKNKKSNGGGGGGGSKNIGAQNLPDKMSNSVNQNRQIAKAIMQRKYPQWNQQDYRNLVKLWNGESGWNAKSDNPTSSAYGIPQALTSVHNVGRDYMHSPTAQILWGEKYIAGKYGDPTKAWHEWLARSPHWY